MDLPNGSTSSCLLQIYSLKLLNQKVFECCMCKLIICEDFVIYGNEKAYIVNWPHFVRACMLPTEFCENYKLLLVDAGLLHMDGAKVVCVAPTKEDMSLRAYSIKRHLSRLRRSACIKFQSTPIVRVVEKLEREIESGRLAIRPDRKIHADLGQYFYSCSYFIFFNKKFLRCSQFVGFKFLSSFYPSGLKQRILDMLFSYNPLWLRIGLETVFGTIIPLQSNTDAVGLSRFIISQLLANPDIAAQYAHQNVIHLYKEGLFNGVFVPFLWRSTVSQSRHCGTCMSDFFSSFLWS